MKHPANTLSVLLAAVLLFSACGQNGNEGTSAASDPAPTAGTEEPADAVTEAPAPVSSLPDSYDLEGYNFRIFKLNPDKIAWSLNIMNPTAETGDVLNDTVFRRNQLVMEKYNFTITETMTDGDLGAESRKFIQANEDAYDVIQDQLPSSRHAKNGYYLDFNEIDWLELDKPWWDQNLIRDLSIDGRIYLMNGDILVSDDDSMYMMMYNRPMAEDYDIENLYDAVDAGKWTYDLMYDSMKLVGEDLNQDGTMDINDRFGLFYVNNSAADVFFGSAGCSLFKMKNGEPQFVGDGERCYNVYEKYQQMLTDTSTAFSWTNLKDGNVMYPMIDNKQILFQTAALSMCRRSYRDLKVDFGLLPLPKFDEAQEVYYTCIGRSTPYLFVPVTAGAQDKVGFVLEALAANSGSVTQAYSEICLQSKYTRDARSYEMIKLALKNLVYDPGFIYDFGSIGSKVRDGIVDNTVNYASLLASVQPAAEAAAKEFLIKG